MKYVYVFLYSGLISIIVDLDHFIVLILKDLPINLFNLNFLAGRPLHVPLLITLFIIFMSSIIKNK
ncbi:hypothetical protein J4455_02945 [Candidatus Woesearchaeota archaeon]|nr:hypothetical protein [Candidatus Woesearchaeota archaeon]